MGNNEKLKTKYLEVLEVKVKDIRETAARFKAEGNQDEYVMGQIRVNVVDIFQKMFVLSYNNIYTKLNNKNIERSINPEDDKFKQLYDAYIGFFEEIPAPWKIKMEKDKSFGKMEEYNREVEKLRMVEALRRCFTELWQQNL
jgi:hypothetical protein